MKKRSKIMLIAFGMCLGMSCLFGMQQKQEVQSNKIVQLVKCIKNYFSKFGITDDVDAILGYASEKDTHPLAPLQKLLKRLSELAPEAWSEEQKDDFDKHPQWYW